MCTAAEVTRAFLVALIAIVTQIKALDERIAAMLGEHADAHIFRSMPRAQTPRAARLIAEIGDCSARFPTPESHASLAGVTPSTRQSGKVRITSFRWSADKQLRDAPSAAYSIRQPVSDLTPSPAPIPALAGRCWEERVNVERLQRSEDERR